MKYAIIENSTVINVAVATEPLAQNWIASEAAAIGDLYIDGQFVKPEPPAPNIPESVTMRQCHIALPDAGLLDAVKSSIATMPGTDGERARIDWEYAQEVRRDWPLIDGLGSQLGMTDQQIDDLFVAAAAVPQ